jgi:16S rRNA (guanine527-N7)-methyltransferase
VSAELDFGTLVARLAEAGVEIDDDAVEKIEQFHTLLETANKTTNLTRITEKADFLDKHVYDALLALPHLPDDVEGPWVDVGSGCGVPGLLLAIARPARELILVESHGRKAGFLEDVVRALGLHASVLAQRAELVGRSPLREQCAAAMTRAVGSVAACLELTLPLVRPGGLTVLYRGPRHREAELKEATGVGALLEGGPPEQIDRVLPSGAERTLLLLQKKAPCSELYPRRDGLPAHQPLQG